MNGGPQSEVDPGIQHIVQAFRRLEKRGPRVSPDRHLGLRNRTGRDQEREKDEENGYSSHSTEKSVCIRGPTLSAGYTCAPVLLIAFI
jgi:hypothetical protein